MTAASTLSLFDAPVGRQVRIRHLHTTPALSTRLREMGFCENALIRMLRKGEHSIVCELYNSRIGLNRELATAIVIAPPGS